MAIVAINPVSPYRMRATTRELSNAAAGPVTDGSGNPAIGRHILCLAVNEFGAWVIRATTTTDGDGRYSFTVQGGAYDRFVLVAIGAAGENSRALSGLMASEI